MKIEIVVMFGGMSSEHSVSCMSAYNIITNLDTKKYDITKIGIDLNGDFFNYLGSFDKIGNNTWREDNENLIKIDNIISYLKTFDVVFPAMHGRYSEDGAIQGILEFSKVKYVGCNIEGSSIGYNKMLSKELVKNIGINIVPYTTFSKKDELTNEVVNEKIDDNDLKFPLFVKPNKEGSSYGVRKAIDVNSLIEAIKYSLGFDDEVLVESYIANKKEVECSVLGNDDLTISVPGEIVSATEIYDFDSKYLNQESYTQIPANISNDKLDTIKNYSSDIFKILKLSGLARIDFFVTDNEIYFNEVNTMPGFTNISMYPKMLENIGISYENLLNKLIELAINR